MDPRINAVPSAGLDDAWPLGIHVNTRIKTHRNWPLDALLEQTPGDDDPAASFAVAHALSARPSVAGIGDDFARDLGGCSLIAALNEARGRGLIESYRRCQTVDEILACLSNHGPVVCTSPWNDKMLHPVNSVGMLSLGGDEDGFTLPGLYSYVIRGFESDTSGLALLRIRTSLGLDWGNRSDAFLHIKDFERYLAPHSEAFALFGRTTESVHSHPPVSPGGRPGPKPPTPDTIEDGTPDSTVNADAQRTERLTIRT